MEIPLMALLAPRRTLSPTDPRLFRRLGLCGFLLLTTAFAATQARAQVTVGGNRPPDVTVDQGVLDQLGPAPTLPQLFGAHGADSRAQTPQVQPHPAAKPQRTATKAKKSTKPRKAVRHKTHHGTPAHKLPTSRTASKSRSAVHSTSHAKTAAKKPAPATTESRESHEKPAAPTPPSIAIDTPPPPAPMPAAPQPIAVPAPPVIPPAPPHVETPGPDGKPLAEMRADSPPTPLVPTPAVASTAKADAPVAAKPAAAQTSAVHVASVASTGHGLNAVKFAPGATELPPGGQPVLDALAVRLLANDSLRVQLIAHATGGTDEAMEARRVSLARAVAVRAYLIGKGVRSLRMDVRALGNHPGEGPVADEVDLLVVTQ
jgi:outer membrane protein OmpA-like peptidoglycan-associated protein